MLKRRSGPIRVLVVEDSPTARDLLIALFNQTGDIQVIGTALDGEEAIVRAAQLRPDLITMDIHMPRLDGLEATRRIMKSSPMPIVMVTASTNRTDMDLTFEALRAGALSVVKKPSLADEEMCERVIQAVRLMADVPVVTRWDRPAHPAANLAAPQAGQPVPASVPPPVIHAPPATPSILNRQANPATLSLASAMPASRPPVSPSSTSSGINVPSMINRFRRSIIGIASSTGGPSALVAALKPLPASFPLPILIVQHITRGFAPSLADWLNTELQLSVHLAQQGEVPTAGSVLIAPDEMHMQISDRGTILLHNSPPYKGLRPSANYLFFSMARVYGRQSIGVILTGMGDDGVEGLVELHAQGGMIIAQDEASSVVYGMPREAVARKIVDHEMAAERIGWSLLQVPMLQPRI